MTILDQIKNPEDIQTLDKHELEQLADDLRVEISESVAKTGGHLASNLGTVELTLSLLHCFDFRTDKVIWDVGHQSYSYKILTGRRAEFSELRQKGGLSGFPKREESAYDSFNTGHSSTSVSAALGLERAMKMQGQRGRVIAVIGDGAMTGGMFYEAINNIDNEKDDLLIIINDNQMSISDNVGALSNHLNNLRVSRRYNQAKRRGSFILHKIPLIGMGTLFLLNKLKDTLRRKLVKPGDHVYFETLGLRYYGPVDGHDLVSLNRYMLALKDRKGPAVLHVCTQKGKGYPKAEQSPSLYHGVSPFSLDEGVSEVPISNAQDNFTQAFSMALIDEAARDQRIVALTAAMGQGTGLDAFAAHYPERFFDVGIAEPHAVTMAAGMAAGGMKPVVCIYSTFMQRALDQLLHDVALQNLPVIFGVDRAGIVGNDGETHQGIYDSSFMSAVPNLKILYPSCYAAVKDCLHWALAAQNGPVAIRYPRGSENKHVAAAYLKVKNMLSDHEAALPGPLTLREGKDVTVLVLGQLCGQALEIAEQLAVTGISVEVIDVQLLKPLPLELLLERIMTTKALVTVEEQVSGGGLGAQLALAMQERGIALPFAGMSIADAPVYQASPKESLHDCGLDGGALAAKIREILAKKGK